MQNDENVVITYDTAMNFRRACRKNPEITSEEIERIIKNVASAGTEKTTAKKKHFSPGDSLTEAINMYCRDMSDQQIDELLSKLLMNWGDSDKKPI